MTYRAWTPCPAGVPGGLCTGEQARCAAAHVVLSERTAALLAAAVPIAVADCGAQTVGTEDAPARIGGEAFVVLMPDCDPAGALDVAQRVREAVASVEVGALRGPVRVTVSIGAATHRRGEGPETLLSDADARLYAAKDGGRNGVVGPLRAA